MKLPLFVCVSSKEIIGGELILCTQEPFYVARAFKFENYRLMEEFAIKNNVILDCEHVPGYYILICYMGTIRNINEKVVLGHNVPDEAKPFLKLSIPFYEKERIEGNETRLKRFQRK